jgi:hypothetical protein
MPDWTETNPLRVVTGYHNVARKFFTEKGFEHVVLLSADGALEAAPLMGTADIILDLVMLRLALHLAPLHNEGMQQLRFSMCHSATRQFPAQTLCLCLS